MTVMSEREIWRWLWEPGVVPTAGLSQKRGREVTHACVNRVHRSFLTIPR
jgi:hypothetical protein